MTMSDSPTTECVERWQFDRAIETTPMPGPWEIVWLKGDRLGSPSEVCVAGTDNRVAFLASDGNLGTARLIAAAPDLLVALRYAWHELNTIRARDGVAYHRRDEMPYCTEEWWDELTEKCASAIEAASGEPPKPWPFKWERNNDEQT